MANDGAASLALFPEAADPCPHCWDESQCRVPGPTDKVFNDECAYCPRTNEHGPHGTLVCMSCFIGFCPEHVERHSARTGHAMYTRIKKTRETRPPEITDISQIGVEAPPTVESFLNCVVCKQEHIPGMGVTFDSFSAISNASSPNVQDAIQVSQWAHLKSCPHTESLQQFASPRFGVGVKVPAGGEPCDVCQVTVNNWLCLTCGHVGCPREQAGGQQHAIAHYEQTGHPLVVKLGTVTPLGADVYCYACDNEVLDVNLSRHVATYGIDMATATKSAKSLGEQMLDYQLAFDFNQITEAGTALRPVFGPGCTGLRNFGNTCYMASVLQVVMQTPQFRERYASGARAHHQDGCAASKPQDCFYCQMEKLAKGMWSGEFSQDSAAPHLNGFAPRDFKRFLNAGHRDFSTAEQQDAADYMRYFIEQLSRRDTVDPSAANALQFQSYDRTQCQNCHGVKYKRYNQSVLSLTIPVEPPAPIPLGPDGKQIKLTDAELAARRPRITLDEILSHFLMPSGMELTCSHCNAPNSTYATTTRLHTFPDVLALHVRREYFCRHTYQAKKLDVNVEVPDEIDLSRMEGSGPTSTETIWSDVEEVSSAAAAAVPSAAAAADFQVDDIALVQLLSMDIPEKKARKALKETQNNFDRALDWVFSHDDADVDDATTPASVQVSPPPAAAASPATTLKGQRPSASAPARYRLSGLISHIGSNANTGHYVAHVRLTDGRWALFNDEKVGLSEKLPRELASVYLYRRAV